MSHTIKQTLHNQYNKLFAFLKVFFFGLLGFSSFVFTEHLIAFRAMGMYRTYEASELHYFMIYLTGVIFIVIAFVTALFFNVCVSN